MEMEAHRIVGSKATIQHDNTTNTRTLSTTYASHSDDSLRNNLDQLSTGNEGCNAGYVADAPPQLQ